MQRIELILKNVNLRRYHLLAWLLGALNLVILFILSFTITYHYHPGLIYFILAVVLILLTAARVSKFNLRKNKTNIASIYVFIVLPWLSWGLYWAAALNVVFCILYIYSVRKFEVIVTGDEIIYPSFPKKKIRWNELQNIILKDGILTIDFKNNKIIQNETEEDTGVDEKKFNEFCRGQLTK